MEFSWWSFALICWERTFLASCSYLPLMATFGKFCSTWHLSPMPIHYRGCLLYPTYILDPLYTSTTHNSLSSIIRPLDVHLNSLFTQIASKSDFSSWSHVESSPVSFGEQESLLRQGSLIIGSCCCWGGGSDYLGCIRNPFIHPSHIY